VDLYCQLFNLYETVTEENYQTEEYNLTLRVTVMKIHEKKFLT